MNNSIDSIRLLRGIAAVAVVLCHSRQYLSVDVRTKYDGILVLGAMGVDLFLLLAVLL